MGKRNWTIALQPHPMPDGHERLVRTLRLVAESARCPTRMQRSTKRADGLDDPADDRMDRPGTGYAPVEEDEQ
jgi:hypothetical protein